ncbi:MAG: radical SAM protein [Ignavibacteriales bacterium]|nr:radical SAM protein [Ignavibacteriales bacterium]
MINKNTKSTYSLKPQRKVGIFDYPFTLNPYIGCEMQCTYCFVPGPVIKTTRSDFFQNVQVKINFEQMLKKELEKYSTLPQHLKRVQIGVTTELFQPKVTNYMKTTLGYDLIEETLKVFKANWDAGNKWMLHILTKNHNIISYLPLLKTMKDMIQVEFSFIHHDDTISREYEKYTSSITKRLDAVDQLSKEGIFVRIMAMPFYGDQNDLTKLKDMVFNAGAQAFKNKSLNYYEWNKIKNINPLDPLSRSKTKTNIHIPSLIIKSGEDILPHSTKTVLLPKKRKRKEKFINWSVKPVAGLELQTVSVADMGYSSINSIDWGYLK